MARYTQEISVIISVLICIAAIALISYFIYSLVKKRKMPAIVIVLMIIVAIILAIVIASTLLAGNNHPAFAPTY